MQTQFHQPLLQLYRERGALVPQGAELLHHCCPDSPTCWGNRASQSDAPWNSITRPHVGKLFESAQERVLALGLNLYGFGGLEALEVCARGAQREIGSGRRSVTFGNVRYRTNYWHRLAVYSAMLIDRQWAIRDGEVFCEESALASAWQRLARVFDEIAIAELVKCSPPWARSKPTAEMLTNCPRRFAEAEIQILNPTIVLCIGHVTSRHLVSTNRGRNEIVSVERVILANEEQTVVTVPHPNSYGGTSTSLWVRLAEALMASEQI